MTEEKWRNMQVLEIVTMYSVNERTVGVMPPRPGFTGIWAFTNEDDWCGEFERKPEDYNPVIG